MTAPSDIKFRFNPSASRKVLGPLEGEIMDLVWEQGRTTVSAVHKALREKKDIAYTTVMTTMSRLAKKRLLDQDRSSSVYLYSPSLSKNDFERYVVMGVINALIEDYGDVVAEYLVDGLGERNPKLTERLRSTLCK